ncbi:MAG TPA: hypothetical protein VMU09_11170 [Acidimicrobiales bacterium]|nr:hypothetical protein [Acidimicrobiales bacterium]
MTTSPELKRHLDRHATRPQKGCRFCEAVRAFDDSGKLIVREPVPAPTLVATKATVLGPAPFGGTITTTLDDVMLDRALAAGGTIVDVWNVFRSYDGTLRTENLDGSPRRSQALPRPIPRSQGGLRVVGITFTPETPAEA